MSVINVCGTFDKRHMCIAIGIELLKFGSVMIVTDNPLYKYISKTRDQQFMFNGVGILYTESVASAKLETIIENFSNVIIDTFEISNRWTNNICLIYDDISYKYTVDKTLGDNIKTFHYTATEGYPDVDVYIEKNFDDDIEFMGIVGSEVTPGPKIDLLSEVIVTLTKTTVQEYESVLREVD